MPTRATSSCVDGGRATAEIAEAAVRALRAGEASPLGSQRRQAVSATVWMTMWLMLVATSCVSPRASLQPRTKHFVKQGEPGRPLVQGEIVGVEGDTLVTVDRHTPSGRQASYFTRRGDGPWEMVVTKASGTDYVLTAQAEGYASQPISYTIHLSGETAYLVSGGQLDGPALGLDFHFEAEGPP